MMLNSLYATLASPTPERDALSPKTICYIHTTIHKALADAADADLLSRNPAERAKPPRVNGGASAGVASWDADELGSFLAHTGELRLGPIWRLAAMTGMRRGEILGLRWADVDLDAARLSVRHALVAVGYEVIESTPKSHNARVVDLDAETITQLRRYRRANRKNGSSGAPTTRDRKSVV